MSFLTSIDNEKWISSPSYLFDTISFDDLFFVTDNGKLCCKCFHCGELESVDKVLRRSLFPLNFLFFEHSYSDRFRNVIQDFILRAWDCESVHTIIVSGLPDTYEIFISDLYTHCDQHFDVSYIPYVHIFDLKVLFKEGSLKSDIFPFWISSLRDKKSIYSRVPIMHYFEKGLSGFSFDCKKCDCEYFCSGNRLIRRSY